MTRIAGLAAVALLTVACGGEMPKSMEGSAALQELPKPDEVAYIEMKIGSQKRRIDDAKTIAAALEFLEHELTGWTGLSSRPIHSDAVFAAFVRKSNRDPCAFFIESDTITVAGTTSGGEVHASRATIVRLRSILGISGL